MNRPAIQTQNKKHVVGHFNYLSESTVSSLYRNGRVLVHRDRDGNDGVAKGMQLSRQAMTVVDARELANHQRPCLAANGFALLDRPVGGASVDFLDLQQVINKYYPQCERVIAAATGGRAFAFDHNVRSVRGKRSGKHIVGGQKVQEPLHLVHGDYTLTAGPQRLRDLAKPPSGNDTLRAVLGANESLLSRESVERALAGGGRFAIINLWRNIAREPVVTHPLALCDGQTVDPEDLVVFEIHYPDRIGENYFAKHASRHGWYYFPEMTGEEALLIKQWDSAGPLAQSNGRVGDASDAGAPATFSFHSAIEDPSIPSDAPDRYSIEVRCVVLYD